MIDGNSAWGSPPFSHPDIVQGTMRTLKTNSASNVKFHNEARLTSSAQASSDGGTLRPSVLGGFEID
jgi:hypothetical protein